MNKSDKILKRLRAGDFLHEHPAGGYFWHGYGHEIEAWPYKEQTDRLVRLGKAERVPATDGCKYHVVAAAQQHAARPQGE